MKKGLRAISALLISIAVTLTGCTSSPDTDKDKQPNNQNQNTVQSTQPVKNEGTGKTTVPDKNTGDNQGDIDLAKVKPNEAGKIMVVMFHNFIETYKSGDKQYTTTFGEFRSLLQTLYDKGYRLVNMNDYINNNIDIPAGNIPMVFTFDDGTAGQFNLVEENGQLVASKQSAVGIMEEFNKQHPDFGLKGTFYVNLGDNTFTGKGTLAERLKYLKDKGFEIGNHTYTHIDLKTAKTADKIIEQVGGNQKAVEELVPGYKLTTLALPLGHWAKEEIRGYVTRGEFEGVKYENAAIMLVGANPAPSPVSVKFKPLATPRVRATGIEKVDADLAWWMEKMSVSEQYVSDGNADTITVPKAKEAGVDKNLLNGKKLIVY
ncbi:MAG: polysaccharide deacetylase family protein [Clostridia bacterium]|nr:polysaccharide deacetylase family protein [Clostridia bacterium]